MMTDPIADMLTRIRNALNVNAVQVDVPASKMKEGIADTLKREGYIESFLKLDDELQGVLRLRLKYGPDGNGAIRKITRVSKPGRRIYTGVEDLKAILSGLGIQILTTSKGVLSDREAKKERVGGEVLCEIW